MMHFRSGNLQLFGTQEKFAEVNSTGLELLSGSSARTHVPGAVPSSAPVQGLSGKA